MKRVRPLIVLAGLILVWQAIQWIFELPRFILPGPVEVAQAWIGNAGYLLTHAGHTALEILIGLLLGIALGAGTALIMAYFRPARIWLMPVLVTSQAIPVFALAPVLVLWLGFGMASKIAMATLIIYFPVAASLFDGLRRTDQGWLDLARTMGAGRWAVLRHVRLPSALPAFASGIRVAAAVAPIGAVVGEWVGASAGLGYIMLHANSRTQTALMFAALFTLAIMAVAFYYAVDAAMRHVTRWQVETNPVDDAA